VIHAAVPGQGSHIPVIMKAGDLSVNRIESWRPHSRQGLPMSNSDTQAAWRYHNGTKHPGGDLMNAHHFYDPMLNPLLFKIYEDLDTVPLPADTAHATLPALSAISTTVGPSAELQTPDSNMLMRVLHYSAGITKTLRFAGGEMPFRAAACTGALYHIEVYVVCGDLTGLSAGVYHYDPRGSALRRLREGDYRQALIDATGQEPAVANAPAILVYTDVFWRNAVKYQAREYRHAFWDSGTIIANTLATAAAFRLPARVVAGFVDESVSELLDLDPQREAAVAMVPLGHTPDSSAGAPPDVGPLGLATRPVSDYETDFPAIREMHEASSLKSRREVVAWRDDPWAIRPAAPSGTAVPLKPLTPEEIPQESIEAVIARRGSTRRFSRDPISLPQLSTMLNTATGEIPTDFMKRHRSALNDLYLIVNAVDGLQSGSYVHHGDSKTLELLSQGDFRRQAGHLALDQELGADASVNVYFAADLAPILERLGNRGYRAAQLEASIAAGRLYLAAYALRLSATGLTFYDDVVTDFLSPHARGKSVMFLVAVGKRARRR